MRYLIILALAVLSLSGCGRLAGDAHAQSGYHVVSQAKESRAGQWSWQLETGAAPLPIEYSDTFNITSPFAPRFVGVSWRSRGCDLVLVSFRDAVTDTFLMTPLLLQGDQNGMISMPAPNLVVSGIKVSEQATAACQVEFIFTGTQ